MVIVSVTLLILMIVCIQLLHPICPSLEEDQINYSKTSGIKKEWLYDLIDLPYENIVVKAPRKYHEILVYEFGEDYMTPPPADKQIPGNEKNYWID